MNKEIKTQWINALLSGEYEQGKGYLRSSKDEYCCLGVLCDLYSKETGVEWGMDLLGSRTMHSNVGMTPDEVDHWAGFTTPSTWAGDADDVYSTLTKLADMNDGGRTFEEIVEVIKEKL